MKRGCLGNLLFGALVVLVFGVSSYVWFTFFIRGRSVSTPNLVGRSVVEAKAICSDVGLNLLVDTTHRRNADKIPAGNVAWQNREPGTTSLLKRGTTIRVELSAGPLVLRVPELAGQTPRTAQLRLGQQSLKLGSVAYAESTGHQGILGEEPQEGTVVAADTPVSVLVGVPPAGPAYVMPDLIDQRLDLVRPTLETHGLVVSNVKFEAYPGIADGIIIRQFPLRGAPVSARDPITVVVSRQEETAIVEQPAPPATTTR